MPNSQTLASPAQFAANRANADRSTGPRSAEGKARSAQNARKHGFAAAAYTAVGLEDVQEVANLRDDAIDFYQPVNSQELFAVERIALAQQAMLRIARLEAGLFSACLDESANAGRRNFLLADGFQRIAAKSNAFSLCLRYAARAERNHRSAIDDFNRLNALRQKPLALPNEPTPPCALPNEPNPAPPTPAAAFGETKPILPEASQNQPLAQSGPPQPHAYPTSLPWRRGRARRQKRRAGRQSPTAAA